MGHPTCLYHPTEAPEGRVFDSDTLPDANGWVDSPAKFEPGNETEAEPRRRGRSRKE